MRKTKHNPIVLRFSMTVRCNRSNALFVRRIHTVASSGDNASSGGRTDTAIISNDFYVCVRGRVLVFAAWHKRAVMLAAGPRDLVG